MKIGVARETYPQERRVALIPAALAPLLKAGYAVFIEKGAGIEAGISDAAYEDKGAKIVEGRDALFAEADILLQVRGLGANLDAGREDLGRLRRGQIVIAFFDPLGEPKAVEELAGRGVAALSMELMPRSTRAQSMDALSSMATIQGYKAVLLAAGALPRMFPMLMTAAGTLAPARVFVIGAGVAGLQAIATARRLGAVVQGYDVRPTVKDQVQSLGAKFVELPLDTAQTEDKGGYAREQSEDFLRRQRELMARVVAESDVVITTAAIPGKKAPVIITADMVRSMTPGSVIVDLAAERGGNCELTVPGDTVLDTGVTILGPLNLPSTIPFHASQMYAKNIATFLLHLGKKGEVEFNLDDEITRETLLTRDGEVVHPRIRALLGNPSPAADTKGA